jgi:hypothetical protein
MTFVIDPYKPLQKGSFFLEKAIFIVSRHPFFEQFERILLDLYLAMTTEGLKGPLEDYIARLLYQVPAPPRGIQQINLKLICEKNPYRTVTLFYPPINKLPFVDINCINALFESLNVDNVLLFFKRILLDSNNLMVSSDKKKLVQVGEAIKSLTFPFKYEFVFIPYLPTSLIDYL